MADATWKGAHSDSYGEFRVQRALYGWWFYWGRSGLRPQDAHCIGYYGPFATDKDAYAAATLWRTKPYATFMVWAREQGVVHLTPDCEVHT